MTSSHLPLRRLFALGLVALVAFATAAFAETEKIILAFDGKPIRLIQSVYGELDPLGSLADPRHPVIALERPSTDGRLRLELVPGTEGPEQEGGFSLLYDRDSESLFIFWESRQQGSTALNLAGRTADGEWTEVVEVSGNPFSPKTPPRLAITHDSYWTEGETGEPLRARRSILHLVWSEDRDGDQTLVYSPVMLRNGAYLGPNALYDLADLATGEPLLEAPAPSRWLTEALRVAAGTDGHSVVLAFADSATHRLLTLQIEALSDEVVSLADGARSNITVIGHRPPIRRVLDVARSNITVIGHRIHPGVRSFMMRSIEGSLLGSGDGADLDTPIDAQLAASIVWEEIVRAAASVQDQGLVDDETLSEPRILEVLGREPGEDRSEGSPLLQVRVASSRPVPETGDSLTRLFVSPDGRDVIVSWLEASRLRYVESQQDGWSPVQSFELGDQLSLAAAYELLDRRVR